MMPYQAFHAAAHRARNDIDVLRSRFNVSFEQAANRLTMLQRPGMLGVPFFMLEVDHAGFKESVGVDLQRPEGQAIVRELAAQALLRVAELLERVGVHGPAVALVLDGPPAHVAFSFVRELEARVGELEAALKAILDEKISAKR